MISTDIPGTPAIRFSNRIDSWSVVKWSSLWATYHVSPWYHSGKKNLHPKYYQHRINGYWTRIFVKGTTRVSANWIIITICGYHMRNKHLTLMWCLVISSDIRAFCCFTVPSIVKRKITKPFECDRWMFLIIMYWLVACLGWDRNRFVNRRPEFRWKQQNDWHHGAQLDLHANAERQRCLIECETGISMVNCSFVVAVIHVFMLFIWTQRRKKNDWIGEIDLADIWLWYNVVGVLTGWFT